ncbi:MAG TPA: DUF3536 domain-containing protein [Planctomycetota bacterium]|jgi:hypothetical protein|nr:DUF3536 domain-containing protein [Planctomycetota bacterium]
MKKRRRAPTATLVVHGHFYQPPRESPWLGAVPREPSAAPFHDWNERILEECYRPFASAGLFSRVSFDAGPTWLRDLERRAPRVYAAALEGDRLSRQRLGFGNALAHPPVHAILPLLTSREKRIEVRSGVREFERRFLRRPEGFWLPECAVDAGTLAALAEEGISFVVLSPSQVAAVRERLGGPWRTTGEVDPTVPYRVSLGAGREIAAFVYDGELAAALAFGGLATSAERFAGALLAALHDARGPIVHLATDGETYGHHAKGGVEGLLAALRAVRKARFAVGNYASVLAEVRPLGEIHLREPSSWSCAHGVGRWERACGCSVVPGAPTEWRAPLREAIDGAKRALDALFEREGAELLRDPWEALAEADLPFPDRETASAYFAANARVPPDERVLSRTLLLLEMERQARLSKTSCAWFFDDLAGIEPVQVLRHAARALEIARGLGLPGEAARAFEETLSRARAHAGEDGLSLLRSRVLPGAAGASHVATYAAAAALARSSPADDPHPDFRARVLERETPAEGRVLLRVQIEDVRTLETSEWTAAGIEPREGGRLAGAVPFDEGRHGATRASLARPGDNPRDLPLASASSLPPPLGEALAAPAPAAAPSHA